MLGASSRGARSRKPAQSSALLTDTCNPRSVAPAHRKSRRLGCSRWLRFRRQASAAWRPPVSPRTPHVQTKRRRNRGAAAAASGADAPPPLWGSGDEEDLDWNDDLDGGWGADDSDGGGAWADERGGTDEEGAPPPPPPPPVAAAGSDAGAALGLGGDYDGGEDEFPGVELPGGDETFVPDIYAPPPPPSAAPKPRRIFHEDAPPEAPPAAASPEEMAARAPHHAALRRAAAAGNAGAADAALAAMAAEVAPDAAAHHYVIYARVRAGDADGALEAGKAAIGAGARLREASYLALVWAFAAAGDVARATSVIMSMFNAGKDTRKGWLVLCKALFRRGEEEQAFTQVANGAAEGWAPDEALFERMLAAHGARGDAAAAEDTLAAMKALGVVARIAHYNHLVRAVAISRGWREALECIDQFPGNDTGRGRYVLTAHPVMPTRATFDIIIDEALATARAAPLEAYAAEYLEGARPRLEVLAQRGELGEEEEAAWEAEVAARYEDADAAAAAADGGEGGDAAAFAAGAFAVVAGARLAGAARGTAPPEGYVGGGGEDGLGGAAGHSAAVEALRLEALPQAREDARPLEERVQADRAQRTASLWAQMAAGLQTEAGDVAAADVWRQLRGAVRGSTDYARRDSIGALPQTPTRERRAGEPGEWSEAAAAAAVAAGEEPPPRPAEMPREYEPTAAAKLEAAVAVEPLLDALRTRMAEAAVVPDAAHFARRAQLALYCGDVLETLQSVARMRQTGEREWPLAFDPPTFRALLATLARHRRPVELALLLQCVEDSGARLPRACFDAAAAAPASGAAAAAGEDFFAPDGRTPLTSWLATSPEAVRALDAAVLHQRGLAPEFDAERWDGELRTVEVTARYGRETAARIGFANCVVDPLGQPLAITKMKRAFCVAELEARGLPSDGPMSEIKQRVRTARQRAARHIAEAPRAMAALGTRQLQAEFRRRVEAGEDPFESMRRDEQSEEEAQWEQKLEAAERAAAARRAEELGASEAVVAAVAARAGDRFRASLAATKATGGAAPRPGRSAPRDGRSGSAVQDARGAAPRRRDWEPDDVFTVTDVQDARVAAVRRVEFRHLTPAQRGALASWQALESERDKEAEAAAAAIEAAEALGADADTLAVLPPGALPDVDPVWERIELGDGIFREVPGGPADVGLPDDFGGPVDEERRKAALLTRVEGDEEPAAPAAAPHRLDVYGADNALAGAAVAEEILRAAAACGAPLAATDVFAVLRAAEAREDAPAVERIAQLAVDNAAATAANALPADGASPPPAQPPWFAELAARLQAFREAVAEPQRAQRGELRALDDFLARFAPAAAAPEARAAAAMDGADEQTVAAEAEVPRLSDDEAVAALREQRGYETPRADDPFPSWHGHGLEASGRDAEAPAAAGEGEVEDFKHDDAAARTPGDVAGGDEALPSAVEDAAAGGEPGSVAQERRAGTANNGPTTAAGDDLRPEDGVQAMPTRDVSGAVGAKTGALLPPPQMRPAPPAAAAAAAEDEEWETQCDEALLRAVMYGPAEEELRGGAAGAVDDALVDVATGAPGADVAAVLAQLEAWSAEAAQEMGPDPWQ